MHESLAVVCAAQPGQDIAQISRAQLSSRAKLLCSSAHLSTAHLSSLLHESSSMTLLAIASPKQWLDTSLGLGGALAYKLGCFVGTVTPGLSIIHSDALFWGAPPPGPPDN